MHHCQEFCCQKISCQKFSYIQVHLSKVQLAKQWWLTTQIPYFTLYAWCFLRNQLGQIRLKLVENGQSQILQTFSISQTTDKFARWFLQFPTLHRTNYDQS